jgi:hypothetical protein
MSGQTEQYIALEDAAEQLKVTRATLYYYIRTLKLETKKFPLDRRAYLLVSDFNQIKALKEQAAERGESKGSDAA